MTTTTMPEPYAPASGDIVSVLGWDGEYEVKMVRRAAHTALVLPCAKGPAYSSTVPWTHLTLLRPGPLNAHLPVPQRPQEPEASTPPPRQSRRRERRP